jgi:hypothetical protein
MLEWGAASNVIAYNYNFANFDSSSDYFTKSSLSLHGAHPQFNLSEGNIDIQIAPDSTWGSSANITLFRNFVVGTSKECLPLTGRGTVTCSPMGTPGANGVNGWWESENVVNLALAVLGTNYNSVGNVYGSTTMATMHEYSTSTDPLLTLTRMVNAICGPSPCGANTLDLYDNYGYNYTIGYWEGSAGAGSSDKIYSYNTLFLHGDYSSVANAITWASGVTHSLPASFYLSSEPVWFGTVPWPAIGPDVSNGNRSDSYGYANKIPAEVCYESVMGGTDGTGSPLTFNASTCYGQQSPPAPPMNPSAVAH